MRTILIHLPAYREPELIPTIEDCLKNAKHPERVHFGICRQYHPDDGFDDVDKYRDDPRFKIKDIPYEQAKGLATARAIINDELLTDEDFVCQLDSHHRFAKDWDSTLIDWYDDLKSDGYNPIIGGYLPYYNPFNDPAERVHEPWLSEAASFYPHGTIFIRPTGKPGWKQLERPYPARFLSGHFAFGPNKWARDVRHDPNIFFAGEEINLTVRSYTHGYDLFHPHRVVIWHATMREERAGKLVWDDQSKRGDGSWHQGNDRARSRIRQLFGLESNGHDLGPYTLGSKRSLKDYETYAGIDFEKRSFQKYTKDNKPPPNPQVEDWDSSLMISFYHLVNITRSQLPGKDYKSILIAFDDKDGIGLHSKTIQGSELEKFKQGDNIHYEEMFLTDQEPSRMVAWAVNNNGQWAERIEINL